MTPRSGYVGLQFSFDLRTTINSNLNEGFQSERRLQKCDLLGMACGCGDSHRLLCIVSGEFDHFARPVLQLFGMVTEGGIGNAGQVIKCFEMIKKRAPQNPNMDVWFLIAKLH